MNVKKHYKVGDDVWIFGITVENKITKGKVISAVDLSTVGFIEPHYIISIPTHIEPLLEIRTWQTMSQDENGPIGSLRELGGVTNVDNKKMRQAGYVYAPDSHYDDDPSPDQIMAALEKSTDGLTHKPLQIKEAKPKRKYYPKRKKP